MAKDLDKADSAGGEDLDLPSDRNAYVRLTVAALGGIPWVGGFLAASAAFHAEREQRRTNEALRRWLEAHETKLRELHEALSDIAARIETLGDQAKARVQDDDYLTLVGKGFRVWDRGETSEKRAYVQRLLTNAAGTSVTSDDTVRLFLDWIDRFHEAHFGIIRAVYKNRGISRLGIWREMGNTGPLPRENSSEADLFRMLIHDLSTGRVIRQERPVNARGEFLKSPPGRRAKTPSPSSNVMKSSFDDEEPYELSELGQEFVHYVLQDAVSRLSGGAQAD